MFNWVRITLIGFMIFISSAVVIAEQVNLVKMTPSEKIEHVRTSMYEDIPVALNIVHELLDSKQIISDSEQEDALVLYTLMLLIEGQYEDAKLQLEYLSKLSLSPSNLNQYYYISARYYQIFENYELAFLYLNYAAQVPDDNMSVKEKIDVYTLATSLNIDAGTYEIAEFWINKAIELSDMSNQRSLQCTTREEQVYLYAKQHNYKQLAIVIDDAIELCQDIENSGYLLTLLTSKSFIYFDRKDYVLQQKTLVKALSFDKTSGSNFNTLQTRLLLAQSYINTKDWRKAKDALSGLLVIFSELDLAGDIATIHRLESLLFEHENNIPQALNSFKQYLTYQAKFDAAVSKTSLAPLNAQFSSSINQQHAQIKQLENKKAALLSVASVSIYVFYSLVILFIGVVVYFSVVYSVSRRKVAIVDNTGFDDVTGLPNAELGIKHTYILSERGEIDCPFFTVAAISIEQLNMVKESYSLDRSDKLLSMVAHTLSNHLKTSDVLFRFSDSILMAVTRVSNKDEPLMFAEQIKQSVSNICWDDKKQRTIGVCIGQSTHLIQPDTTRFDIRQTLEHANDAVMAKMLPI